MAVDDGTKALLDAAKMGLLHRVAISEAAHKFRDFIRVSAPETHSSDRRTRKPQALEVQRANQSLDALLGELIAAQLNKDSGGYFYRGLNRAKFTDDPHCRATSRRFEKDIASLEQHALIESVDGYQLRNDFDGTAYVAKRRSGRYRATQKLIDIAASFGVYPENLQDHYSAPSVNELEAFEPVQVRRSKSRFNERGEIMRSPRTERYSVVRSQIELINQCLAEHEFSLPTLPVYRRTFAKGEHPDFDYNFGGRLTAEFHAMPSESRQRILMNGEATVEIDIKACQPTILCGLCGVPVPEDFYNIPEIPRSLVKAMVTMMIGRGRHDFPRWTKAILEQVETGDLLGFPLSKKEFQKKFKASDVVERLLKTRPVLRHLREGGHDWSTLQYLESEVIVRMMNHVLDFRKTPILSVHDSIIVPKSFGDEANFTLKMIFKAVAGVRPNTSYEYEESDFEIAIDRRSREAASTLE